MKNKYVRNWTQSYVKDILTKLIFRPFYSQEKELIGRIELHPAITYLDMLKQFLISAKSTYM